MFGNMNQTCSIRKNAESVERLSVCSPVNDGVFFFGEYQWMDMASVVKVGMVDYGHNRSEEEFRNL